jgi:5-methylcytosine-specific restriction enzyme A
MCPVRLCLVAACPNAATVRGRCATHATEARKYTRSPNDAWYSSKPWKMSREAKLAADPLCERCGQIADSVHHKVPIEAGGARRDPTNLESICRPCHSKAHAAMNRQAPWPT